MAYTTINKSTDYFNTKLYTGNSTDNHAITGVGFQPDWVWIKRRNQAANHNLFDAVRGVTKTIKSNLTNAEATVADTLKSFDSDGFTLGDDATVGEVNPNTYTMASWNWKAGTTSGITTTGSTITPTAYSFNATSGFSIIKYDGNGTANAKFPHGLSVAPKVVIIKQLDATNSWYVHHHTLGSNTELYLNGNDAAPATTGNDVTPDATNIQLSGTSAATNGSGNTYIAYCFAEKAGYSKIGTYIGNGNSDGTFVYTGFKPAWIMTKRTNNTENWYIKDNKRSVFNPVDEALYANSTAAELSNWSGATTDYLSNGFKIRTTDTAHNGSGDTYIYMALGQSLVGSNNIPCTAR